MFVTFSLYVYYFKYLCYRTQRFKMVPLSSSKLALTVLITSNLTREIYTLSQTCISLRRSPIIDSKVKRLTARKMRSIEKRLKELEKTDKSDFTKIRQQSMRLRAKVEKLYKYIIKIKE